MQPVSGHPKDTFGYSGTIPSPVVDLLSVTGEEQVRQLIGKNELSGVAWGPHAVNALPAPVAGEDAQMVRKSGSLLITKPIESIVNWFQPEIPAPAQPEQVMSRESIPAEARPLSEPSIVRRLQTLQQLYDQKLIDESEYKEEKQRILKEL
jgi:hypothetical protein